MNEQASIILVKVGKVNKSQILLYCTRQILLEIWHFSPLTLIVTMAVWSIMIMKTHSTYKDWPKRKQLFSFLKER